MIRLTIFCLPTLLCFAFTWPASAQPDLSGPPVYYEVLINGESFRVESNRVVKVESQQKPGTSYEVAVRIAPTQPLRLNTVQMEYDLPAKITDDHGRQERTVRLKHELGFSMSITDVGGPIKPDDVDGALSILTNSVTTTYDRPGADLAESKPFNGKFGETAARGAKIQYRDPQGFGQTCLAYVLTGPKFTLTCLIQYRDTDADEAKPLIKKILDSVRPLER